MKKLKRDIHIKLTVFFNKMKEIINSERIDLSGRERKVCKNCYLDRD